VAEGKPAGNVDLPDFLTYRATGDETRSLCTTVCKWTYLGHEEGNIADSIGRWDDSYWRINLSLDSLNRAKFALLTGQDALDKVLDAIAAAEQAGFSPIKINAVIIRGYNDDEIVDLAEFSRQTGHVMRFIEFMPLDNGKVWKPDMVVPGAEIFEKINAYKRLVPLSANHRSETARRFTFEDGRGEIGIIASVTQPFCGRCNRIRLTADGQIRTCLFSLTEHDTKTLLRNGASDGELTEFFHGAIAQKEDGHHINDPDFLQPARTMSHIGG